jgi:hypothetical protein
MVTKLVMIRSLALASAADAFAPLSRSPIKLVTTQLKKMIRAPQADTMSPYGLMADQLKVHLPRARR